MSVALFVLGRPGSGKTTAVKLIIELCEHRGYFINRVKDYEILYDMFLHDTEQKRFVPSENEGFEVLDFSVLDEVLKQLEQIAQKRFASTCNEIIIIEFARSDYHKAFKCFSREFLKESYFFFVEAPLDICIQRIHRRITFPVTSDHHYVPDEIVRGYYSKDNYDYMAHEFNEDYGINKKIKAFDNSGSWEDFIQAVNEFAEVIFKREDHILRNVKDHSDLVLELTR